MIRFANSPICFIISILLLQKVLIKITVFYEESCLVFILKYSFMFASILTQNKSDRNSIIVIMLFSASHLMNWLKGQNFFFYIGRVKHRFAISWNTRCVNRINGLHVTSFFFNLRWQTCACITPERMRTDRSDFSIMKPRPFLYYPLQMYTFTVNFLLYWNSTSRLSILTSFIITLTRSRHFLHRAFHEQNFFISLFLQNKRFSVSGSFLIKRFRTFFYLSLFLLASL